MMEPIRFDAKNRWRLMRFRCYSKKMHDKRPTYIGCSMSQDWQDFDTFFSDYKSMVGVGTPGWHLDKDLLVKGNKVYGKETCVLLPPDVNVALTKRKARRGSYPIGVSFSSSTKKYQANCNDGEKMRHLGVYDTVEEAFSVYKAFKELFIKSLAEKYKDNIDPRAYTALLNYSVEITD